MKSKPEHIIVGKFLKDQRLRANLTQSQVAQELGYTSPQFISNIERGLCSAPMKYLKGFLKLYKLSLDELLSVILKQEEINLRRALTADTGDFVSHKAASAGSKNSSLIPEPFGLHPRE